MSHKKEFTTEELEKAVALRANGVSWKGIGAHFRVAENTIRKQLEPGFSERTQKWEKIKVARRKLWTGAEPMQKPLGHQPVPTTLDQIYFGDPLPGRSALDRMSAVDINC